MVKVLRVVDECGSGLYEHFLASDLGLVKEGEEIPRYQPILQEERVYLDEKAQKNWRCAFSTDSQFMSWFRDIDPLDIYCLGGKVLEIEIPQEFTKRTPTQVAYDQTKVESVREVGFEELIERLSPFEKIYRKY